MYITHTCVWKISHEFNSIYSMPPPPPLPVSAHIARAPYAIRGPWIQDTYGSQSRYTRVARSRTRLIGVKFCVCDTHVHPSALCSHYQPGTSCTSPSYLSLPSICKASGSLTSPVDFGSLTLFCIPLLGINTLSAPTCTVIDQCLLD
jgi:hypothetical protein